MQDKEQIIIDGVNIFDTLDNWADLISQEWCSGEYPVAEIIKNYILDINKQLARKTQECEELRQMYKSMVELCESKDEAILEKQADIDELKRKIFEFEKAGGIIDEGIAWEGQADRYRKALEEIEQELKEDIYCESQECGCDDFEECLRCTKNKILDIINKAKEDR